VQNQDSRNENNKTYDREVKCIWGCSKEEEVKVEEEEEEEEEEEGEGGE
jgi:hypothetical protein